MNDFLSPVLADVEFDNDGALKQNGKQSVKFYNKKRLSFKAKRDDKGELIMDSKTGLPAKEAFEETVEMVRVETKGDTNIKDDVADDFIKHQYRRNYMYFREGRIPDGIPLEQADFLQPTTIMELHMLGIHVVEQIASMTDLMCEQIRDQSGFEVRDIAQQSIRMSLPEGQALKTAQLERELLEAKSEINRLNSPKNYNSAASKAFMQAPDAPDAPMKTMDLTPEQFAQGKKGKR